MILCTVSSVALQSQLYDGLKKKYCYFIYYLALFSLWHYISGGKILSFLFRKYCEINKQKQTQKKKKKRELVIARGRGREGAEIGKSD